MCQRTRTQFRKTAFSAFGRSVWNSLSGVNGSVTLGEMDWRKGQGNPGDGSYPMGSRGEDPIGSLVDEPHPSRYLFRKWM